MSDLGPFGEWTRNLHLRVRGAAISQTARSTYWLGSSSVVNGLLGAVASALLARTLGIDNFGTYTLLLTLVNLLADLSDLGLGSALVRFGAEHLGRGDRDSFGNVLAAILRWKLLLSGVILGSAVLFLRPLLALLFSHVDERIGSYFFIALLTSMLSIAAAVFPPIFQAFGDFRAGALTSLARSVSRILLIAGTVTTLGKIPVTTALWIEAASVLAFLIAGYLASPVKRLGLSVDPALFREMFAFTRWVSLYQLINLLGTKLDVFIVGGLADARTLGLYGAAAKVSGLVIAVTNAYYTVLLTNVSAASSLPEALARRARQARLISAGLAAAMLILAMFAPLVIRLLFGPEFAESGRVLQIMCIGLIFTVLGYPPGAILFAEKRTGVFPIMAALSAVGMIAGNYLLLPRFGASGAAMAFSLSAFLAWATATVAFVLFRRANRHTPAEGERDVP